MAAFNDNALTVLDRRYLRRDDAGDVVETPADMLDRVATAIAEAERAYPRGPGEEATRAAFLDAMTALDFLPNSPTLVNAGRELGQLSACFVLPVEDSMPAIFDAVKWAAVIQQTGGGTGFAFSRLRPAGDRVASTSGMASGPVPFIDVFNAATDAIRQGGVRRGANMGILRVDHPDILAFVAAKSQPGRLHNFNVSVAVTDAFMTALSDGADYALVNPRSRLEVGRLDARKVWETITRLAWLSGEPGVIFIDRINRDNPTPGLGQMESTNPCGELPLLPFESCNLGSINVARFVHGADLDWERLARTIRVGVRFLDDVIDVNRYPLPQIEAITRRNRKIGLGIMGWADALSQLDIAYDSEDALSLGERLARFVAEQAQQASAELAVERGPFPEWPQSRWQALGHPPLRNATTTSIAPTGTISILAGCSGGIEPLFAVSFVRQILDGARLVDVHPGFVARAKAEGWYSPQLLDTIAERGSVRGLAGVPERVQRVYPTAYDIAPAFHVRMQAAFQAHVDNAVSKTINLPRQATVDDVVTVYEDAYRLGCKGVTIYRDGSRDHQVLSFGSAAKQIPAAAPCPECGAELAEATQGACTVCLRCGFSRCA